MIRKIPPKRWKRELEEIFAKEFDSDLPNPKYADIFGEYDHKGKLISFILKEKCVMVGQIYLTPELRKKNNGQRIRKLVNYIVDSIPDGCSIGAVASEKRFEGLFRLFGMQKIKGSLFRRNF